MIIYQPLWDTMKQKNITTYYLINKCGFSSGTIHNLKKNKGISTTTLNDLCNVLECNVENIMVHVPDKT